MPRAHFYYSDSLNVCAGKEEAGRSVWWLGFVVVPGLFGPASFLLGLVWFCSGGLVWVCFVLIRLGLFLVVGLFGSAGTVRLYWA